MVLKQFFAQFLAFWHVVLSARVAVLARLLLQCRGGVARVCERMYRVRVNI
jgi:hypothetical protein